jgi:hypothetical protein
MIKKTKKRHTKKSHTKKSHTKKSHTKKSHTKKRQYKKRHSISKLVILPGSQGIPVFSAPIINPAKKIYIESDHKESGNIIPGLRTYLRNIT